MKDHFRRAARNAGSALAVALMAALMAAAPAGGEQSPSQPGGRMESGVAESVELLAEAIRLDEILEVIAREGEEYAMSLEAELFPGRGGAGWQAVTGTIYAPDKLRLSFLPRLEAEMKGVDTEPLIAFFTSPLGRKVIGLEISARQALLDDAVEAAAREALAEMRARDDPRLALIGEFIAAGDLVEYNVAGALNANFAFYRGLRDGGAFPDPMSDEEMLADVWLQERAIRDDVSEWLHSYLALAYRPLSDDELAAYVDFTRTAPARRFNAALFAAFDEMFNTISYMLGRAAAERMKGADL